MSLIFHWKNNCEISEKYQKIKNANAPVKTDGHHVHNAGG
jgi:hypothetical protein